MFCADQSSREGRLVPPNYDTIVELLKLGSKAMLVILGLGSMEMRKLQLKKEKHTWSVQVLNELFREDKLYKYESSEISGGSRPKLRSAFSDSDAINQLGGSGKGEPAFTSKLEKPETPLLMAARNGITEIMEKILHDFPHAIHDIDTHKKNVVLLAVQYRQPHVYQFLLKKRKKNEELDRIFLQVDDHGNSARHLAAATIGDYKPWRIPGAALQLQWEIKWYKYVKNSMPQNFFRRLNDRSETPKEIFNKSHQELVRSGGAWLTNTSQSCSVVAALIATVAFATSANVPGGNAEKTGTPVFENQIAFKVFAISSLVALCFSITSVIMFLAILTSRYEAKDFREDLPTKVLLGLTSLFVSIAAILLCFCAGHFFVLSDELKFAAFPLYGVTCLPVTFFAIAQFPLYIDLIKATLATVPQRRYAVVTTERDTNSSPKSDDLNQPSSRKSLQDQGNGGQPSTKQSTGDKTTPNQETNQGTQSIT
ncbi:PREDICTED: ankyrin repeat-containing protein At3g12360-like [Populus euphratica]|uniref:Ankyrin repeat-containing protein At3g12360-like n=1 Tax=Populus euphratica TaxID=75702 RepID=A0AAJ6XBC6_POPEU|nr:PREDICTED: ankyrin repeat-containing protein At3g12360-like [Populus euphratica]